MGEVTRAILVLMVGWILGLVSPQLSDFIQRPYRRRDLKRSIFIELEGLRPKLAANVYQVAQRDGKVDRALLEWAEPIMHAEKGDRTIQLIAQAITKLLAQSTEQVQASSQYLAAQNIGTALNFKNLSLPFITSQLSSLSLFSPEFQRLVLKILARLEVINEEIAHAWFSYSKTFDSSLSAKSSAAVTQNMQQSYEFIAALSRNLIDDVDHLLAKDD